VTSCATSTHVHHHRRPERGRPRVFYRDFGLAEREPGRFATAAGGEQLRQMTAPRRNLLELGIGRRRPRGPGTHRSTARAAGVGRGARGASAPRDRARDGHQDRGRDGRSDSVQPAEPARAMNGPDGPSAATTAPRRDGRDARRPRKLGTWWWESRDALPQPASSSTASASSVERRVPGSRRRLHALLDRPSQPARPARARDVPPSHGVEVGDVDEIGRGASGSCASTPSGTCGGSGGTGRVQLLLVPPRPGGHFVE